MKKKKLDLHGTFISAAGNAGRKAMLGIQDFCEGK